MKSFLSFAGAIAITASAFAGDGNPFPPKRIQIEFDSPFHGNRDYKFTHATAILQLEWPNDNKLHLLKDAHPSSLTVELGSQRLRVADTILHEVGQLDLSSLEFEFGFGQYRLRFTGTLADERGEIAFFWSTKESKLLRVTFNQTDRNSRYPTLFERPQ